MTWISRAGRSRLAVVPGIAVLTVACGGAAFALGPAPIARAKTEAAVSVAPTVYVANDDVRQGTVTPISTSTNKPGKAIKVGQATLMIVVTPNGKTAYVANLNSATVTPITTATNKPGRPIKVGSGPEWIAITPNGKTSTSPTSARIRDAGSRPRRTSRGGRSRSASPRSTSRSPRTGKPPMSSTTVPARRRRSRPRQTAGEADQGRPARLDRDHVERQNRLRRQH